MKVQKLQYSSSLKNIVVVGAGLMGSGIAQVAAQNNFNVTIVDNNKEALEKGRKSIIGSIQKMYKKTLQAQEIEQKTKDVFNNIKLTTDLETSCKNVDLFIEAIVENIEVKQEVFKRLMASSDNEKAIFCSNTSSLSISEIAKLSNRKDKFAGLHFFSPVPQMKLVEVIRTNETSQEVYDMLFEFVKKIGKVPVACKDTPGFIVNRLLLPYMQEAIQMLERGDAKIEDIDQAMKLGAGYPMGPFQLMDMVGLDVVKFILDGWRSNPQFSKNPIPKNETLEKMVKSNTLGRKSGKGFYDYTKNKL